MGTAGQEGRNFPQQARDKTAATSDAAAARTNATAAEAEQKSNKVAAEAQGTYFLVNLDIEAFFPLRLIRDWHLQGYRGVRQAPKSRYV